MEPVLDRWCTGCHASDRVGTARFGAPVGMDYDGWARARVWAQAAADAAGPGGTMPPLGGPTDAERGLLVTWADCGAPGDEPPPLSCDAPVAYPGDLFILFEADTASFCDRYNAVDGRVQLNGLGAAGLDCLCEITGDLVVASPWVTALDLPHLTRVGGHVSAIGQPALEAVRLPALTHIGGDLRLVADNLAEVHLPALAEVGGSLLVQDDETLAALALPALTDVAGDLLLTSDASIEAVDLSALETVGGQLEVLASPALVALDLSSLAEVEGALRLQGLDALSGLSWPSLERVGADVEVLSCDTLQALSGPDSLVAVAGSLRVRSNAGLETLDGFGGVPRLGILSVAENPRLRTVRGFGSLRRVDTQFTLARNDALVSIPRFDRLDALGGRVEIVHNPALTAIRGMSAMRETTAEIWITDSPALESIDGLGGLTDVGGLALQALPALTDASGLASLTSARSIIIEGTGLPHLGGLSGLDTVDDGLFVWFNQDLADITGLHGLTWVGGDLEVGGNPSLSWERTMALVDALGPEVVAGTIYIDGNAL
ncbi:MAG: hypothetical protein ACI8PZ_000585 [Myxococcota bacterium]